jgi:hypothetical protein
MPPALARMAPTGVVVLLVLWCVWPYMIASSGDEKRAAKLPEVSAAALTPKIASPPKRDPFRTPTEVLAAKQPTKPQPAVKTPAATKEAAAAAARAKNANPLDSLVLSATCISGDERMAVVNGRIYHPREKLKLSGTTAAWLVTEILPEKVLLENAGKTFVLKYSDRPDPKAAASKAAPKAGGATARKPSFTNSAPRAKSSK